MKLTDEGYEVVFDGENYTTKLVEPKLKTLTDEEIYELASETASKFDGSVHVLRFARAILRKASEK